MKTIAKYDNPEIKGKTWLRDYSHQKSDYCKKWEVKRAFIDLIQNIDAKYIFLSYNSDWLLTFDEIKDIMSSRWGYWFIKKEYKRFRAYKKGDRKYNESKLYEYLHYLIIKN